MFRRVVYCSGGLCADQERYMMKKIMMVLVATNVVARMPTDWNWKIPINDLIVQNNWLTNNI